MGLPSFASINYIDIETRWEKLKTRREVRKLFLFYKIVNGQVPDYLTELVPPTVGDTNNYNIRKTKYFTTIIPIIYISTVLFSKYD